MNINKLNKNDNSKYKLKINNKNIFGCKKTDNYADIDNCKNYDSNEISYHNKKNDCWISVNGDIYNLTDLKDYYKNNTEKLILDSMGYTHIPHNKFYNKINNKKNNNEYLTYNENYVYNNLTKYKELLDKINNNEELSNDEKKFMIKNFKKNLDNSATYMNFKNTDDLNLECGKSYLTLDKYDLFTNNLNEIKIDFDKNFDFNDINNCVGYWSDCEYNEKNKKCTKRFNNLSYINMANGNECNYENNQIKNCDLKECNKKNIVSAQKEFEKTKKKIYKIIFKMIIFIILIILYFSFKKYKNYILIPLLIFILQNIYIYFKYKIAISKKKKIILDYNYFKIGEIKHFNLTKNIIFISLFIINLVFIYLYFKNHNSLYTIPTIIFTIYLLYILSENYFDKQNKTNNIIDKINKK